jgi:hypothetical protein
VADPISSAPAKKLLIPCNLSLKPIPNGLDEDIATMGQLIAGETGTTTRSLARILKKYSADEVKRLVQQEAL